MNREELAQERMAARAAKDWVKADQLRDQIAALGFDVIDIEGGYEFRELAKFPSFKNAKEMKKISVNGPIAYALIIDGFQADALETVRSIRKFSDIPLFLLVLGKVDELMSVLDTQIQILEVQEDLGWGENANALVKNINAEFIILADPSTRFIGDAITPVLRELQKREYSVVGWRGGLININDEWRSTEDKGPGEVDVLFSYFLAMHREDVLNVNGFNPRALYYRNADIEFSLKLRHAHGRLLQMDLPLEQGRHHGYYDADSEFREVQSKKNYNRILEKYRGKNEILSPRR